MKAKQILNSYISGAIEDTTGRKFLRYGSDERHVWLPFVDVATLDRRTIERLSRVGLQLATTPAKEAFKREAQSHCDFEQVSIADVPGYCSEAYVFGDGRVRIRPMTSRPFVVFESDDRFTPSSSLDDWQEAIGPIVTGQPLLLFALAYSFVAPLLRFAPADLHNPFVEIVGGPNKGKSTLAKLTASMWGGSAEKLGVCQSWDYSPAMLDPIRHEARDRLLVLDEAAKAGENARARAEKIGVAIFRLCDASPRRVLGVDPVPPIRQAVLSTSNIPMLQLVGGATKVEDAIVSRVLTLIADRRHGILDSIPDGFDTSEAAVVALDQAITLHYGKPSDAFMKRLLCRTRENIQRSIVAGMTRARKRNLVGSNLGPRQEKTLAITYAAGLIGQKLGVVPLEWGDMDYALRAVIEGPASRHIGANEIALDDVRRFIQSHSARILDLSDERLPLSSEQFDAIPGVWIERDKRIVIPTQFFRQGANADDILRGMQALGRLDHDDGKLSKKAPRAVTSGRRAYFIDLSTEVRADA